MSSIKKIFNKTLDLVPEPITLFFALSILTLVVSYFMNLSGVSVIHPVSGDLVIAEDLFNKSGIQRILTNLVSNFINFPPLGIVLATMIGVGLLEKSGYFNDLLSYVIKKIPDSIIVPSICFISVNSSLIADAGVIIIPPLAALVYQKAGRNTVAGLFTSFVAVVGGFSANVLITPFDIILSELSSSASSEFYNGYLVLPQTNYYFMVASTLLVTVVCAIVNNRIIEKILPSYSTEIDEQKIQNKPRKLLLPSLVGLGLFSFIILIASFDNSLFRDENNSLIPFYKSIVPFIIIVFFVMGLIYGIKTDKIKSQVDLQNMLGDSLFSMSIYILIAFFAGQFIAYFEWTNLGVIISVKGANFLESINLTGIPLIIGFLIFSAIINIFIASASAKWTIFAPVFIPMLLQMGISPELTQLVYRVADSSTNMITPLLPYLPLLLVYVNKYDPKMGIGKVIRYMIPYSIFLFFAWALMLIIWVYFEIPIGPDSNIFINVTK